MVLPAHIHQAQKGKGRQQKVDIEFAAAVGEAGEECSPAEPCSAKAERRRLQKEQGWRWSSRYMG
jgi:hypothetical protein